MSGARYDALTIATSDTLSQRAFGNRKISPTSNSTISSVTHSMEFLIAEEVQIRRQYDAYCALKQNNDEKAIAEFETHLKNDFLADFILGTHVAGSTANNAVEIATLYNLPGNGLKKMLELLAEFRKTQAANATSTYEFRKAFSKFIKTKLDNIQSKSDVQDHEETFVARAVEEPLWLKLVKKEFLENLTRLKKSAGIRGNEALEDATKDLDICYRNEFLKTMTGTVNENIAAQFDFAKLYGFLEEFGTPKKFHLDESSFKKGFYTFLNEKLPKSVLVEQDIPVKDAKASIVQPAQPETSSVSVLANAGRVAEQVREVEQAPSISFFSWNNFKRAIQEFASWLGSIFSGSRAENHPSLGGESVVVESAPQQSQSSTYKDLAAYGLVPEDKLSQFTASLETTGDWLERIGCEYTEQMKVMQTVSKAHANELESLNKQSFLLEMTDGCDSHLVSQFSLKQLHDLLSKFSTPNKIRLEKPEFQQQFQQFLKGKLGLQQGVGASLSQPVSEPAASIRNRI